MTQLAKLIAGVLAIDPVAPALEFGGVWQSWGALGNAADRLDSVLAEAGLGTGARVGVLLRNRPEFVPVLLCLLGTGRCLTTLNANAPLDKLSTDIARAAPPVVIGLAEDWDRAGLADAAAGVGALALDVSALRILLPAAPALWQNSHAPGIAIEMLTSGTTGTPKRIPLSASSLEKALLSAAAFEKGRGEDAAPKLRGGVQIVSAPLAHIAGITGILNNVLAGRKICLLEKFTVSGFVDAVTRYRPKVAGAPPSALRMILDADVPQDALSSLVAFRTGTAPLDPDLADAFYDKFGIPVLQNYGATEFAGGAAGWSLDDFKTHRLDKRGSVGRLNRGAEARTVDPASGETLPVGEQGLLEIRAPNIADGKSWVRTTDLAIVDADRFLWIKGRFDNAIIRGGFKILPDDVVSALQQHPAVREAAVAGMPDRRLGEVPVAAYIRKSGAAAPDPAELDSFLRARLMPYQVPVRVIEVAELPRTPSMKVSLPDLRALFDSMAGA
jgi:acyl-CoA synthetase (AMP-forming)/AMP-acid ligase II